MTRKKEKKKTKLNTSSYHQVIMYKAQAKRDGRKMTLKEKEANAKALAWSNARLAKRVSREREERARERMMVRNDIRFDIPNESGDGETVATEALTVFSDDTVHELYMQLIVERSNLLNRLDEVNMTIHEIEQSGVLEK